MEVVDCAHHVKHLTGNDGVSMAAVQRVSVIASDAVLICGVLFATR